ncbi:MAG: hypothetical protein OXE41_08215 [Gammaproteobacteria bacterium]|nr:hypothetical protein [Gammaproteobacteria bacterium]MCY4218707.1 hypothetical protein [Gammaproteobacteria bacterium]MCY4275360.1 hypothetical protein [Gammaproteobacteria bacterium]
MMKTIQAKEVVPPVPKPRLDAITVCYNFGCKTRSTVNLSEQEWLEVANWFNPPAKTPKEELRQIKHAIGWMEVLIGRYTPTHKDLAFSLPRVENYRDLFPGQQDCIDESTNTTTYLLLFEKQGLLQHFEVIERAYRQAIFDQHWAAQVREKSTGSRFVVDSWFQPNGYLPVIQASEEWEDIPFMSAVIDSSTRQ